MHPRTEQWLFGAAVLLIAVLLIGIAWWRSERVGEPPATAVPAAAEDEDAGPKHPVEPAVEPLPGEPPPPPLPSLDASDEPVTGELGGIFGEPLGEMLAEEALIEKFVATIDNLPREDLAERLRPLAKIPGSFEASDGEQSDRFTPSPDNYRRYDTIVSTFGNAPTEQVVALYRRYYPLLQQSYEKLGYPDAYFNDRMIEVIDHLLATPDPDEPPALVRPHVLFEYADPELEALSSGQKALLRIGPEHRAVVMEKLREIRAALAEPDAESQP